MRQLASPLLLLAFVCFGAAYTFIQVMYDGYVSQETVIEALNYSVQTITSVGYGNWEQPAVQPLVPMPRHEQRVLRMRAYSIVFMLIGAATYTATVGAAISIFLPTSST